MKLLYTLTGSTNLFINFLVLTTLLLLLFSLGALVVGCVLDPSLIVNASF